jgi:hypothetical protein
MCYQRFFLRAVETAFFHAAFLRAIAFLTARLAAANALLRLAVLKMFAPLLRFVLRALFFLVMRLVAMCLFI